MDEKNKEELTEKLILSAEAERQAKETDGELRVFIEMEAEMAMIVCGLVQLALRFPGLTADRPYVFTQGRQFIDLLIAAIRLERPQMAQLMELGNNPDFNEQNPSVSTKEGD